jgi:hypothetical protein
MGTRLFSGTPALVQVDDDDGPALRLLIARKLVAEGLSPATTAVVSRNTGGSGALAVTLSSSDTTEAIVPVTVIIPESVTSATFEIATLADETGDGNQTVTLTASAAGYASANPLPALSPSQTNRVNLLLTPPPETAFGQYGGTLVLSEGHANLTVPFEFRVLSEARGDFKLTVVDEYTDYAQGFPRVSNATVVLFDSITRVLIAEATTDLRGELLLTNMLESYYDIEVKAEAHGSFRGVVFLSAGKTNEMSAFLPRQTVPYSWSVVPTQIEDRTRIVLETTFESYVPIPVITVNPASFDLEQITQEMTQIDFTISNHGLVAAFMTSFCPTRPTSMGASTT